MKSGRKAEIATVGLSYGKFLCVAVACDNFDKVQIAESRQTLAVGGRQLLPTGIEFLLEPHEARALAKALNKASTFVELATPPNPNGSRHRARVT